MKTQADLYYDTPYPGGAEDKQYPETGVVTLPLTHYIPAEMLTDVTAGMLASLKDGNTESSVGRTISYSPYGQSDVGTFTVTLTKTVNDKAKGTAPDVHATEEVSEYDDTEGQYTPAETYVLTVTYSPKSEAERRTWLEQQGKIQENDENYQHHGLNGMAKEASESTSENTHKIIVFAKKLQLLKADQFQETITGAGSTAEFGLYRKATAAEETDTSVIKVTLQGLTGSYVLVQTLTTSNGTVTTERLPLVKGQEPYDEPYYLVETNAPDGYNILTEPLKVSIDMTGHNTWTKKSDNTASQTRPNPYTLSDWLQEATIKVLALDDTDSNFAVRVLPEGQHGILYDHTNDTTDTSVQYKIINNAGVELPSTGGPGLNMIYLLGITLTIFASVGFVMQKRRRPDSRK